MKIGKFYIFSITCTLILASCSFGEKSAGKNANGSASDIVIAGEKECKAAEKLPSIIEVVFVSDKVLLDGLMTVCEHYDVNRESVYQWRNHVVIYDVFDTEKRGKIIDELSKTYSDTKQVHQIKDYDVPYYIFDRTKCDNKEVASEWSHTVMTANIVADSTMQQEYLDYHATQAEQWPEIANGFCKADFQQLLMFRNGRQLMLIISIPKGKNLNDLNPHTTEDNPRVDEWNAIMAKYQEGIDDADEGEVWVMFEQLNIKDRN